MDVVNEILQKAAKDSERFKPITVEKHLDVDIDLGNLFACDLNEIDLKKLRLVKRAFVTSNLFESIFGDEERKLQSPLRGLFGLDSVLFSIAIIENNFYF